MIRFGAFRTLFTCECVRVCVCEWGREWVGKLLNGGFSIFSSPIPIILNYLMHIYNRLVANSVAFSFSFFIPFWILPDFPFHLSHCLSASPVLNCFVALTICSGFAWQMNYLCIFFCFSVFPFFCVSFTSSAVGSKVKYLRLIFNLCRVAIKSRAFSPSRCSSLNP